MISLFKKLFPSKNKDVYAPIKDAINNKICTLEKLKADMDNDRRNESLPGFQREGASVLYFNIQFAIRELHDLYIKINKL
jgi:hypothetical protein